MNLKPLLRLSSFYSLVLLVAVLALSSCTDECESTTTYLTYEPVYLKVEDFRNSVKTEGPRPLQKPGKIYTFGTYLFVNEQMEGIHIIDNSNPSSPQPISFLAIPGNVDMAVKGNTLYADSYMDLVVMDITNPVVARVANRVQNILPVNGMKIDDNALTFLAKYEPKKVTVTNDGNCGTGNPLASYDMNGSAGGKVTMSASPRGAVTGKGGSMARFTLTGDHLYTVSLSSLQHFDVSEETAPKKGTTIPLGWGIETIFPYQNKLFIGSTSGMHIYDNSNPANPVHLSTYAHVNSCDPVVVEGDLAWVTLRSGNACAGFTNQLDLINISDPKNPKLLKTYPMENPHGLGIDASLLFLCEGTFGLKVFDIKDPLLLKGNQRQHIKNLHAYDVIPLGTILLMVGDDGLYQFDYSNPANLKLMSKIPVVPAA